MKPRDVLVVGSAHIDVIGDYSDGTVLDKIGTVRFSVGGSAFNMAVDLARRGRGAYLLTVLKHGSLITPLVRLKLRNAGVKPRYVASISRLGRKEKDESAQLPASGFVAHRLEGELVSAVSSCLVESIDFAPESREGRALAKAVARCSVVVTDANLNPLGLLAVLRESARLKRPVVLAAVSERKIRHIVSIPSSDFTAEVVCANELEIASLDPSFSKPANKPRRLDAKTFLSDRLTENTYVNALCVSLHTKAVAVTRGDRGASIYFQAGGCLELPAPLVSDVVSTTGAGDAFAAALAACLQETGRPLAADEVTSTALKRLIYEFVPPVLAVDTGTEGANLDLDLAEQARASGPVSRFVIFVRDRLIELAISKGAEAMIGAAVVTLSTVILSGVYVRAHTSSKSGPATPTHSRSATGSTNASAPPNRRPSARRRPPLRSAGVAGSPVPK